MISKYEMAYDKNLSDDNSDTEVGSLVPSNTSPQVLQDFSGVANPIENPIKLHGASQAERRHCEIEIKTREKMIPTVDVYMLKAFCMTILRQRYSPLRCDTHFTEK